MPKTVSLPKGHEKLAEVCVGVPYGHVPGHQYADVEVLASIRDGRYRVQVVESWGSAQGYDEERGRLEVVARDYNLRDAFVEAKRLATAAEMDATRLAQAISKCEDEAEEAMEGDEA